MAMYLPPEGATQPSQPLLGVGKLEGLWINGFGKCFPDYSSEESIDDSVGIVVEL